MKRLTQTKLFDLLSKPSEEINLSRLEEAYENFAMLLFEESNTEQNLAGLYRRLTYARIEIASFNKNSNEKPGEKNTNSYFNYLLQSTFPN